MGHRSQAIEPYVGKPVKIDIKTNATESYSGILKHNENGFRPYVLVTEEFDLVFTKSQVVNIEEV